MRLHRLRHRVVRGAGPRIQLEHFLQHVARTATDRGRRNRRAGIEREAGHRPRGVARRVVHARRFSGIIKGARAQRLSRNARAEPSAGLVRQERMEAREPEIALDVRHTGFTVQTKLHSVIQHTIAGLRPNVDDAIARARAIQRGPGGTLHHFDALDVLLRNLGQVAVDDHAVHDVEWILATT